MILATTEDYDYPHIDWHCKTCGEVYCYAGYPPETRCIEGHGAGWRPEDEQVERYINLLKTLEDGDGIVVCGSGPAPLMGPIESVGGSRLVTESIDSPGREIRWDRDEGVIEWRKADGEYATWSDVYHVEPVEVVRP